MPSATADPATLIADLRKGWPKLKDADRARAVSKIHTAGISLRALAKELPCSPTQIRKLNQAAQAPTLDRLKARMGKLSTRELARRGRDKARKALEEERKRVVNQVSQTIGEWLQREGYSGAVGEKIIDEARYMLATAEAGNQLPRISPPPPGTPIEQIIEKTRPPWAQVDTRIPWIYRAEPWDWYAQWLTRWVYFALPDSDSRHQALKTALELESRVR